METHWIQTKDGLYMEIIDPDWGELQRAFNDLPEQTLEEMREASRRYLMKRYGETISILSDPETMNAIREGQDNEPT